MNWSETLATSWHAIRSHAQRSLLTVLGILVGIDAVVVTVGLGLAGVETQAISALQRGRGLWKVAGRSFVVQHALHPHEARLFDTDARMH